VSGHHPRPRKRCQPEQAGKAARVLASDAEGKRALFCVAPELGQQLKPVTATPLTPSPLYACSFSPDGARITYADADGKLSDCDHIVSSIVDKNFQPVLQTPSFKAIELENNAPLYALAFDRTATEGTPLYVTGAAGFLYHLEGGTLKPSVAVANPLLAVYALAAHPRKRILAIGTGARPALGAPGGPAGPAGLFEMLTVWTKGGDDQFKASWPGHTASITGVAFSPNGELLGSIDRSGKLILWDVRGLVEGTKPTAVPPSQSLLMPSTPLSLAWDNRPSGGRLAVACSDGTIYIKSIEPQP
jgi:WD40 repeat protein